MAVTEYRFVILWTLRDEEIEPDGEPRGASMLVSAVDLRRSYAG